MFLRTTLGAAEDFRAIQQSIQDDTPIRAAVTNKTRQGRQPTESSGVRSSGPVHLIVRRGALRRFNALKKKTKDLPVVVSWDRRTGDRSTDAVGQYAIERRQPPPFPWDVAEFVVVSEVPKPTPPRKRKSPPANTASPRSMPDRRSKRRS